MQKEICEKESTEQQAGRSGIDFIGRDFLALLLLSAVTITIYSHTLGSPFVLDDSANILKNQYIRIADLKPESLYNAAFKSLLIKRPVSNISFALNYYFGHYNVLGYHIVNIFIHMTSGMVLYLFLRITLNISSPIRPQARLISFFVALIWLVHPVQTQSVTYIVQRMTGMAALFYLLTMLLYAKARMLNEQGRLKTRKKGITYAHLYIIGAFFSGIIALGSKENSVTLPFFLILYEWFFFQDMKQDWLKRNGVYFLGIFSLFLLLVFIYVGGNPFAKILSQYQTRDFSLVQRLLTESRVVIYYLTLLAFPHPSRLNLEHDFPLSYSLTDPVTTIVSIGFIIGMLIVAILIAGKERLLSFCILWFLGNLVLESSFIGLEIIFEHRLYLPSMLISIIPVTLFFRHIKSEYAAKGILCLFIMVFSIWTYQRNQIWKDEITLFTDCVQKSPNKARPHISLGIALIRAGRNDEAMIVLSKAVQLNPKSASAHNSYGVALSIGGDFEQAIPHFEEAIRILPIYKEAKHNLDKALAYQEEEKLSHRH